MDDQTTTDDQPKEEFWYRAEDTFYSAGVDEYGDLLPGGGPMRISLTKYTVLKHTPCGAWLRVSSTYSDRRFVRREGKKRFACPTKRDALESLWHRRQRQAGIYEARAADARAVASTVAEMIDREADDYYGPRSGHGYGGYFRADGKTIRARKPTLTAEGFLR